MKGYYEIKIRRAGTKALRKLAFHNHIKPGLYDILFAKQVNDTTNSVIDTLVLGNGVGEHSDTAKNITGDVVFSKKYNSYMPPNEAMLTNLKSDLLHTFAFSGFVEEIIEVGEVAVGAYINDVFVAASMIHVQDANGNPTKITLLPGDEISIDWVLTFTRPYLLATDGRPNSNEVIINTNYGSNTVSEYDIELVKTYPNWNLMGYSKITEIILATNKLLTNTEWEYRTYVLSVGERKLTDEELKSYEWMSTNRPYITTNYDDPNITPSGVAYIPYVLMPLKLIRYSNNNQTQTTPFTTGFNTVIKIEDAYDEWKRQYASSAVKTPPTTIDNISVYFYGSVDLDKDEDYIVVSTTPFVYVTLYIGDTRFANGIANEFGKFMVTIPVDNKNSAPVTYTAVAHTHKDVKSTAFTLEYKEDPSDMIFFSGAIVITRTNHIRFTCKRSKINAVYRAVVEFDLVPDADGNPRTFSTLNYNNFGINISNIILELNDFLIGDKIKITLLGSTNNVLHSVFNYTVDTLDINEDYTLQTKDNPYSDHITVGVKKVK